MTIQGRHSREGHRWLPAILLALVVAGMVGAAGYVGWVIAPKSTPAVAAEHPTRVASDAKQASNAPDAGNAKAASNPPTVAGEPGHVALNQCQALFARQARVALVADASLDQWRLHIDAMNQLVAGDITLAQATKYWEDTRVGAHHNAREFRLLDAGLRASTLRCTVPDHLVGASPSTKQSLAGCETATNGFAKSMAAARVAVATWVHHIHDMNALRAGRITAAQATAMWTQSWHTGAHQLKHYDRRAARALHQDCG